MKINAIWKTRIFAITWLAYFGFYLTRKSFSVAKINIDIDMDDTMLGAIDSAYLIAYTLGQFVMGAISDKIGPRRVVLSGLLISIITAIAMSLSGLFIMFLVLMFIQGLCQSSGWAPLNKNMSYWFRREERGSILGFWCTNYAAGGLVAAGLAGWAVSTFNNNWRFAFYVPAACLFVIWLLFFFFQKNKPTDVNLETIEEEDNIEENESHQKVTLIELIKQPMIALLGAAYFLLKPTRYAILFWGPLYVSRKLQTGTFFSSTISVSFEFAGIIGAILAGVISDKVFKSKRMPVCVICLFFLSMTLFFFDGMVSQSVKKTNKEKVSHVSQRMLSLAQKNNALKSYSNELKIIDSIETLGNKKTITKIDKLINGIEHLRLSDDSQSFELRDILITIRKIKRSEELGLVKSADVTKKKIRTLYKSSLNDFSLRKKDPLTKNLKSLLNTKQMLRKGSVIKIYAIIDSYKQRSKNTLTKKYINEFNTIKNNILLYLSDRGDDLTFDHHHKGQLLLTRLSTQKDLSSSHKQLAKIVSIKKYYNKESIPETIKLLETLSTQSRELLQNTAISVNASTLLKDVIEYNWNLKTNLLYHKNRPEEKLNNGHKMMVFLLFMVGFLLYAPDALISSAAAVDFGHRRNAGAVVGFVNGCGSTSAIFSGIGVGMITQHYSWSVLFQIFGIMILIAALILLPKWNALPNKK